MSKEKNDQSELKKSVNILCSNSSPLDAGNSKRLTMNISSDAHIHLKIISAKTGITMGELIRGCIDKFLTEIGSD